VPTFFDLTQPLRTGAPVFPGDPPVALSPWAGAAPWHVSELRLGSHSGTHMDAPRHLFAGGAAIDGFGPERWFGRAWVVPVPDAAPDRPIGPSVLAGLPPDLPAGWFALLATGWDRYWGDADHFRHPFLDPALAAALLEAGAGLVGIDAASIDSSVAGGDGAHRVLLGAGVPVVEHLRGLDRLRPWTPYRALFAPLPLVGADGAPVRAVAWEE
jgi:arylformamidase